MIHRVLRAACVAAGALSLPLAAAARAQGVPSTDGHLGFPVGEDRKLADWSQITGYFAKLAAASPAVKLDTLGPTTGSR